MTQRHKVTVKEEKIQKMEKYGYLGSMLTADCKVKLNKYKAKQ